MSATSDRRAVTSSPVLDVLAERYSTRVFDPNAPIDESAFASALEAARWAPSASNHQPWRFIVTRRGTADFEKLASTLVDFNRAWAPHAGALVVVATKTTTDDGRPNAMAQYDAGQAAAHFTVQAHASGLFVRQMSGFSRTGVSDAFELDDDLLPLTVIAVGSPGDPESAPLELRQREAVPRSRRPIAESIIVNA